MATPVPIIHFLVLGFVTLLLGACNSTAPPADPYDPSKMDLKPTPAKVSAERHTGVFAEGSALSMGAELKPLDPSPVKTVRLDTTHKIIEIAPLARSFIRLRKDYMLHTRASVARSRAITTAGPSRKRLKNFVQQGRSE